MGRAGGPLRTNTVITCTASSQYFYTLIIKTLTIVNYIIVVCAGMKNGSRKIIIGVFVM